MAGRGSKSYLLRNLEPVRHPRDQHQPAGRQLHDAAPQASAPGLPAFRMLSVDGGHTMEVTLHDLMLANCLVRDDGLVVLDDFLSPTWVGVTEALVVLGRLPESHLGGRH